jgi:hypothetical protein
MSVVLGHESERKKEGDKEKRMGRERVREMWRERMNGRKREKRAKGAGETEN